jgi:hypothetical protein
MKWAYSFLLIFLVSVTVLASFPFQLFASEEVLEEVAPVINLVSPKSPSSSSCSRDLAPGDSIIAGRPFVGWWQEQEEVNGMTVDDIINVAIYENKRNAIRSLSEGASEHIYDVGFLKGEKGRSAIQGCLTIAAKRGFPSLLIEGIKRSRYFMAWNLAQFAEEMKAS